MESAIIAEAAKQGLGYVLFVILFVWVMKKNDQRETKSEKREEDYQSFIHKLQNEIGCTTSNTHVVLSEVADDVDSISVKVNEVAKKVDDVDKKVDTINHKLRAAQALADTDY